MKTKQTQTQFKRIETKYILTKEVLALLQEEWKDYLIADDYPASTISNVYFDNKDFQMIQDSISHLHNREKVRMRTYEEQPNEESQAFLEIKEKKLDVGYKFRLVSNPLSIMDYVTNGLVDKTTADIEMTKKLHLLRLRYGQLQPMMYISYKRHSLRGIKSRKIRLTIDQDLLYRTENVSLTAGNYGQPLLEEGKLIMEIKVSDAMPQWLADILKKYQIEPQSFSKYATAYRRQIDDQKEVSTLVQ
ncbi:polyphosphate polymerase domain-containing protein [Streptococcus pantholopis]|uniref:Transporter n=1 Tax=Streptococcus pantholopis TaxID=1811193 RepID=A0A172Q8Z9_9STRE|nr:polyphosphate polymerase domain-containing protein [Streptococcus pantholopis]AND79908.1 transporter [Streptococcus pantholopis]